MLEAIAFIVALLTSSEDVERLRRTDPQDLTTESAREQIGAARTAAFLTRTDPGMLLSIAWHESRYTLAAVTNEPGGKVSCGVMTPIPRYGHCPSRTLVESYIVGGRHVRTWIEAVGPRWAWIGYAGGYRLIKICKAGGASRGCSIERVFRSRAERITGNHLQRAGDS